jgi:DNA adenine methylase
MAGQEGRLVQYLGGKSRIARQIANVILDSTEDRQLYIEPFVGGGSVAAEMVPHFETARLSDASPDLIELWQALQSGWEPPESLGEDEYRELRNAPPGALRSFAGYGCSFGGKWFGGYARNSRGDNFAGQARNSLIRKIGKMPEAAFCLSDYRDMPVSYGSVVYLDPPYAGTTGYTQAGSFDSPAFWDWARACSADASVFVSEYSAPEDWIPVWEGRPQASLRLGFQSERVIERLWVYDPAISVPLAA